MPDRLDSPQPPETPATSVQAVAADYFSFMAHRFPVMCASDEFHFFPRAQAAADHLSRLDDLSEAAFTDTVDRLNGFTRRLDKLDGCQLDPEAEIDCRLLKGNLAGALIALDEARCWQTDPLMYLKVAFIGLDHAAHKPSASTQAIDDRLHGRLTALPDVFDRACRQLTSVAESRHAAALAMIRDCHGYLNRLTSNGRYFHEESDGRRRVTAVHDALDRFRDHLQDHPPMADDAVASASFDTTLKRHFQCRRSADEIHDIAEAEWHSALTDLHRLQKQIDPQSTWLSLYHGHAPDETQGVDTLDLYRREIKDLQRFFSGRGFDDMMAIPRPVVRSTPEYLASVRSSASFAAALTPDPSELSCFYVTAAFDDIADPEQRALLAGRLHREYAFLTAHETFPGHHYLDSIRRGLANPVRRQIESPLFYEGWATYVEHLVTAHGRCTRPIDRLIHAKRGLWRAARCKIDVGLATERMDPEAAAALLVECGFAPLEARRQVRRFRLNPGYQLCYTLGKHEILRLKRRYEDRLGEKRFHASIVNGGQLPFDLIDQRLNRLADPAGPLEHGNR